MCVRWKPAFQRWNLEFKVECVWTSSNYTCTQAHKRKKKQVYLNGSTFIRPDDCIKCILTGVIMQIKYTPAILPPDETYANCASSKKWIFKIRITLTLMIRRSINRRIYLWWNTCFFKCIYLLLCLLLVHL